jgi:hypothetical protein
MVPRSAIQRFDLSFSYGEFSLEANRRGFIGHRVLPIAPMTLQSGNFLRLKIASLLTPIEDLRRNADGGYNRTSFEFDQAPFATVERGAEELVDDREIAMYGAIIKQEVFALKRAINRVLQVLESNVAQTVFDTTTFTGSTLTGLAGAVSGNTTGSGSSAGEGCPWNGSAQNKANATPIEDIDFAREQVLANSGSPPNALILTDWTLLALVRTAEVQNLLKYSGWEDPTRLMKALPALCELLQLEEIIVGKGWKNVSNTSTSDDFDADDAGTEQPLLSRLWDPSMAMVAHISREEDVAAAEPTIGRTFMFSEENAALPGGDSEEPVAVIVEEYREEARRGGTIRARADWQTQVFHPQAGFLLTDVAIPSNSDAFVASPTS